jgi:hypothetical protein
VVVDFEKDDSFGCADLFACFQDLSFSIRVNSSFLMILPLFTSVDPFPDIHPI